MIDVAAAVLHASDLSPGSEREVATIVWPQAAEIDRCVGSAEDGEGTFYLRIHNRLADEMVKADERGRDSFQPYSYITPSLPWERGGDAYWVRFDAWRVGIRPEDITEHRST